MRDKREFDLILREADGQPVQEYTRLAGDFDFARYVLHSLRLVSEAADAPEAVAVIHVPQIIAGFPEELIDTPIRRTALEDYLTRKIADAIEQRDARFLKVARPGPVILPRTSVIVAHEYVEARVMVRLPAREGRIDAAAAGDLFFEDIPAVVSASLIFCYLDEDELRRFVRAMEDADAIRRALSARDLAAFVSLDSGFEVAEDSLTEIDTPNSGPRRGLGIPTGVTLLIGDRYSGRADLVQALAAGVYNHVPGERAGGVITSPDAVEIVAEPGRSIQRVNVSLFLRPGADGSGLLATANADAAESQRAAVAEAIEAGAQTLLVDEANSAPDFLSADSRLARLPLARPRRFAALSERIRRIADEGRITWIVGADACAAQFIPAADRVLLIENRRIRDVTKEAKALNVEAPPAESDAPPIGGERPRWVYANSIYPAYGRRDYRIEAPDAHHLLFGRTSIDLRGVTQLADAHQTLTIGLLIYYAKLRFLDEDRTVAQLLDDLDALLSEEGLDGVTRDVCGDLARPRRFEIAAALNRLETLRVAIREEPRPGA